MGDWDSTVAAFSKTKAEHGAIDVLVNNAGITRDRMFLKMTREDWDQVIETNLNRDRKSTRLNSSHIQKSRMPSSA